MEHFYKIINKNENQNIIQDEIEMQYFDKLNIKNELSDCLETYYNILENYNYESLIYLNSAEIYEGIIPDNILEIISRYDALIIGNYYNVKLDNLPLNVKLINICTQNYYKHPLNNLPSNLEHIIFNTRYQHMLDFLPNGLKTLEINGYCDMSLFNLPPYLKTLSVGGRYNQPFRNLPDELEILILSDFYQVKLQFLPPKLKSLYIGSDYYLPLVSLPDSIEILTISGSPEYIDKLPSNLKILNIMSEANFYVKLPDSIEQISVDLYTYYLLYNLLSEYIPKNLKRILLNAIKQYDHETKQYKIIDSMYCILDEIKKKYVDYEVKFI